MFIPAGLVSSSRVQMSLPGEPLASPRKQITTLANGVTQKGCGLVPLQRSEGS